MIPIVVATSAPRKFAGFDGVFFTGISESPVYLLVENGKVVLRDAGHLWGRDTMEMEGEALSLISCVMRDRRRAAGRLGFGALMGSKRVKAIVVKGDVKVPIADEAERIDLVYIRLIALI